MNLPWGADIFCGQDQNVLLTLAIWVAFKNIVCSSTQAIANQNKLVSVRAISPRNKWDNIKVMKIARDKIRHPEWESCAALKLQPKKEVPMSNVGNAGSSCRNTRVRLSVHLASWLSQASFWRSKSWWKTQKQKNTKDVLSSAIWVEKNWSESPTRHGICLCVKILRGQNLVQLKSSCHLLTRYCTLHLWS